MSRALIVSILLCFVAYITCEIIQYSDHVIMPDRPEYLVIPKFDKREVPHWAPGRGRSFIDLSALSIKSTCDPSEASKRPNPSGSGQCKEVTFEVLMFEDTTDRPWMDFWANDDFCCTDDVIAKGGCTTSNLNKLIVPSDLPGTFLRSTVVKVSEVANLLDSGITKHDITKSGIYVLLMAMCDAGAMPVVIDGSVESIDPYGYVPADQFGNMPFNLTLSLMYLIVALTWAVLCVWYSDQIMPLQLWISGVMVVAMIETTLLYFHFTDWNDNGVPTTAITVMAVLFGSLKRAMSRILVMLVALGYGVVRPSLGEEMHRVLYLGGSYFVLSFVYSLMMNLSNNPRSVSDSDYDIISLVVFLLALVDSTFYIWIFTSINSLMASLAARKQGTKYLLYRNFRTVLICLLVFTCAWVLYSSAIFLNDSGGANANWREKWTIDALWELIYFVVFVSIAVLWAPSHNAQRYAYSAELSQLEDDEEYLNGVEMTESNGDRAGDGGDRTGGRDGALDDEYGGRLHDEKDPFSGTGALDSNMASLKKA